MTEVAEPSPRSFSDVSVDVGGSPACKQDHCAAFGTCLLKVVVCSQIPGSEAASALMHVSRADPCALLCPNIFLSPSEVQASVVQT